MSDVSIIAIGGTDSSGGAGLTRDAASAASVGVMLKPVVTAVTAQTDDALHRSLYVPPSMVQQQLEAALSGVPVRAIKIGMLGASDTVRMVADTLRDHPAPVVLDPVLRTSSGGVLQGVGALAAILPRVTLLTPNLDEAAQMTGTVVSETAGQLANQAERLRALGPDSVLIKDGHGQGMVCCDTLFHGDEIEVLSAPRLPVGRRGTGCTLATLIACYLATGADLPEACRTAHTAVQGWIAQRQPTPAFRISDPNAGCA